MERILVIRETSASVPNADFVLDLTQLQPKDCIGCWSCWWKTPGRCVHHDLDDFYHALARADRVLIFSRLSLDFVSGNLKTLFDRMIPMALPFISYKTGESRHVPRYERHPVMDVYYEGEFSSAEARQLYEAYIRRTIYQFCCESGAIAPAEQFTQREAAV